MYILVQPLNEKAEIMTVRRYIEFLEMKNMEKKLFLNRS